MFRSALRSFRSSFHHRTYCSGVGKLNPPKEPVPVQKQRTRIDEETIALLEQLSLVDCANREGIKVLEDSIAFADRILEIDTEGVEPMYTVLENRFLTLREDIVNEGNCQKEILSNATVTEEDYFVAPPGNVAHKRRDNLLHLETPETEKQ